MINALQQRNKLRKRRAHRTRQRVRGSAERPRISFYRSNKHNYAQAIDDEGGRTLASVSSVNVRKDNTGKSSKKVEEALSLGKILGAQMKEKGIKSGVFDRREYKYHGRARALAEGLRESGISI